VFYRDEKEVGHVKKKRREYLPVRFNSMALVMSVRLLRVYSDRGVNKPTSLLGLNTTVSATLVIPE
jgi:hypothetical protein